MAQIGRLIRANLATCMAVLVLGCNPERNANTDIALKPAPTFEADSAYHFIERQVRFGPRVPGSEAHASCGDYLVATMQRFGFQVEEQIDSVVLFGGVVSPMRNIIGKNNPTAEKRVLLAAHWDTRPYADRDDSLRTEPFDGANDGASGVGVLLEIARIVANQPLNVGLDIVFFDQEDQGRPVYDTDTTDTEHYYCLGSRYWANAFEGPKADYGIVLDMVGAENARFTMEGVSMKYAEPIVRKVWGIGNQLGYSDHFRYNRTPYIVDDHTYINETVGIPCIDIIHYDASTDTRFWKKWHTHDDNLSGIDKGTLTAVGQTVVQTLYNE